MLAQPSLSSFFSTIIMEQDSEFMLLTSINDLTRQKADISQRDLSRAINLSLGMTNVLLKRLSQKGLILIQKVSSRNVSYILTSEGLNELARRTYRYVKGTVKKVVDYKETIVAITRDAKNRGYSSVSLLGHSDIDFIIEYAASNSGLRYSPCEDISAIPADSFVFVSEKYTGSYPSGKDNTTHILELLSGAL